VDSKDSDRPRADDETGSAPHFKVIFSTVVALTVLALVLTVLLAIFGDSSDQVKAAAETCSTTYKMGFGAIVGLIGGKAT
jgi:hypothetical protein